MRWSDIHIRDGMWQKSYKVNILIEIWEPGRVDIAH